LLTHAHYNQFTADRKISCAQELGEQVELILLLRALSFSLTRVADDFLEFDKIT